MHDMLKQWRGRYATALSVAKAPCLALAVAFVVSSGAYAASGISLDVRDCALKDVVVALVSQSGSNVIIADDSKMEKRISVTLKDYSLEKALDYIVQSAGVSYRKTDDNTYIIGGTPVAEPAIKPADIADVLPPVVAETPMVAAPARAIVVEKLYLTHSKPSYLLSLLGPDGTEAGTIRDCISATPNNQPGRQNEGPRAFNLFTDRGVSVDTNQIPQEAPVVPANAAPGMNPGAGRTADINTGAAQVPPGFPPGRTGGTTNNNNNNNNNNRNGTTSENSLLGVLGIDVTAIPFDMDNSIIVSGTEDDIEKFKKAVRMLDIPPKQVSIKAEFVEVSTTDIKNFGIDWSLDRINESFSTSFGPSGNVVFGLTSGNLTAQIRAQLTTTVGRIINSPIISTLNNQYAQLQIMTQIPYWETVTTAVGNNVIQNAVPRFMTVATNLGVQPRINGDGTITMMLQPQVSDTGQIVTGPGNAGSIPEQRTQSLTTQRRVANGETIVLGGFIRKSDTNSFNKVPILADLPLVGTLFRTRARQIVDREVLIFVTPTIIPDTGGATVGESGLSL